MKKTLCFFRAFFRSVSAFFKAYDRIDGYTASGKPRLESWGTYVDPYADLKEETKKPSSHRAALIFVDGRRRGETVYLSEGRYKLGSSCLADVVIATERLTEEYLFLEVGRSKVEVHSNLPFEVNGHATNESVKLVDQDECAFQGSKFYFLEVGV